MQPHTPNTLNCNVRKKYFQLFFKKKNNHGGRGSVTGRVTTRTISLYKNTHKYSILAYSCAPRFSDLLLRKAYVYMGGKFYNYKNKSVSLLRFKFGIVTLTPSLVSSYKYEVQSPLWYTSTVENWSYTIKSRNILQLQDIPPATRLKFIALKTSKNIIAHAVGSYAILVILYQLYNTAVILSPSGKLILTPLTIVASIFKFNDDRWIDFNRLKMLKEYDKRGVRKMLLKNRRSTVRGTVKNPCDHPHGGRTRGILRPRTPWNKPVLKSKVYVGAPITLRDILR